MSRRVSLRRIEAANRTLLDLASEDHDELDGRARDALALVRTVLWQIAERKEGGR